MERPLVLAAIAPEKILQPARDLGLTVSLQLRVVDEEVAVLKDHRHFQLRNAKAADRRPRPRFFRKADTISVIAGRDRIDPQVPPEILNQRVRRVILAQEDFGMRISRSQGFK